MTTESKQRLDRGAIGGVDRGKARRAAELLDRLDALVAAFFAAAGDDDVRPRLGKAFAQRAAQRTGAADHHGNLAVKSKEFLQVFGGHRRFEGGRRKGEGGRESDAATISWAARRSRIQSVWKEPGLSSRS